MLAESCHLLPSNKWFPTLLPAVWCHLPSIPFTLRPHHTSSLQSPFFPFNVGREGGKGQRTGEESIQRVGLSVPGGRGQHGDCLMSATSLLGPVSWLHPKQGQSQLPARALDLHCAWLPQVVLKEPDVV